MKKVSVDPEWKFQNDLNVHKDGKIRKIFAEGGLGGFRIDYWVRGQVVMMRMEIQEMDGKNTTYSEDRA